MCVISPSKCCFTQQRRLSDLGRVKPIENNTHAVSRLRGLSTLRQMVGMALLRITQLPLLLANTHFGRGAH